MGLAQKVVPHHLRGSDLMLVGRLRLGIDGRQTLDPDTFKIVR